jgi:hypothetical protein
MTVETVIINGETYTKTTLNSGTVIIELKGTPVVPTLENVLLQKINEVNIIREKKIAAGIPYQFPDGVGTIQTRDLTDVRNIQTNVTTAIILQASGETGAVMVFRDMENDLHQMTPAQMATMGVYIAQQGQVIYTRSWQLKATLETMTLAQLQAFDVEANW